MLRRLFLTLILTSSGLVAAAPITIGESFTVESITLKETRRINVYAPNNYDKAKGARLPVLLMLDGGIGEDFLHIAGLLQVSVDNGSMRPFLLVGVENTERRRDLTGPTNNEQDKKAAPRVGGSAAFREFLSKELMPQVHQRFRTSNESAIIGESLAGLFVLETLLLAPEMFDTYIAFDPSLWWNDAHLLEQAKPLLQARPGLKKTLFIATGNSVEMAANALSLMKTIGAGAAPGIKMHYEPMPLETHQTIYHPAALKAIRILFKPAL